MTAVPGPAQIDFPPWTRASKMLLHFTNLTQNGSPLDLSGATEIWMTAKTQLIADEDGTPVPDSDAVFQKTKTDGAITVPGSGELDVEVEGVDTGSLPNEFVELLYDIRYLDVMGAGPWTPVIGVLPVRPNVTQAPSVTNATGAMAFSMTISGSGS